ncbi:hypothetical protein D3C84_989520 [compost metagenome]
MADGDACDNSQEHLKVHGAIEGGLGLHLDGNGYVDLSRCRARIHGVYSLKVLFLEVQQRLLRLAPVKP